MNVSLAVIGLPLTLVLPGLCTVAALAPHRRLDWLERAYLVLGISLALSGWVGLVLAQIGSFSPGLLSGLLALYCAALGYVAWRRNRWRWPRPETGGSPRWVLVSFLALTVLFALLAFRPFELILGPRDAAVYPATAAQIAGKGNIQIHDPLIPALSGDTPVQTARLWVQFFSPQAPGRMYYHYARMPGFFVADAEEGTVVPQFYHLYPTWLAIAFSLVGIKAGLWMTPYLSLLGGVGVFLVGRRLFGPATALLAYLFLNLNTLQVWFARYSVSEGATQFLLFLTIYGLARLEEEESGSFFGLLAGVACGLVGLVRADFIFPWLLLLPYLAYLFVTRRWHSGHRLLLLALGVLAVHTIAQMLSLTWGYTLNLYYHRIQDWFTLSWLTYPFLTPILREYFVLSSTPRTLVMHQPWRLTYELGAPLALMGLLILLRRSPRLLARIGEWLRRHARPILALVACPVLVWAGWAYLVRPRILSAEVLLHPLQNHLVLQGYIGAPVPEGSAANLVRLGWYLSPLGIGLGLAGILALLLKEANRRTWYLLLLGLFYTFLFTHQVFGEPHHIYIMRRYVPMVIPFFCIAMAYALSWLARTRRPHRLGPIAAAGLAVLMTAYLAWTGLPFFRHEEYAGALAQVGELAGQFGPDDVLLLIDDARDAPFTIATPLQYIFGRNAFAVVASPPNASLVEAQVRRWQAEGRQVYLLVGNDGGRLFLPQTSLRWLGRFELAVPEFEALAAQKPHNSYILRQPWGIYLPEPWSGPGSPLGTLPVRLDLGGASYPFQVDGFYQDEVAPDGSTYCWTKGNGILRLPWTAGDAAVTITLRMAGGKRPAELGPAQVEVLLEGQPIATWSLEERFTTRSLTLAGGSIRPGVGNTVLLSLVSPTWRQVDYGLGGDERTLGVQVDWVQVEVGNP